MAFILLASPCSSCVAVVSVEVDPDLDLLSEFFLDLDVPALGVPGLLGSIAGSPSPGTLAAVAAKMWSAHEFAS